jgi:hypothetical protein
MNLVFTELITAAYGLPVDFTATYTYGWKLGKPLCEATGFILTSTGKKCVILIFNSLIFLTSIILDAIHEKIFG